jgi:hypothetical protein
VLLIGIPASQVNEGRKVSNKKTGRYKSDDDSRWAHLKNAKGTPTLEEKTAEENARRLKLKQDERFVRLTNGLTGTPAWEELGAYARDAYLRLARRLRFNDKSACVNNGQVPMGVRALAEEMSVGSKHRNKTASKTTARLALIRLQLFGFIREEMRGHFGDKTSGRRASRWRLTAYGTPDGVATKDYLTVSVRDANRAYWEREAELRRRRKNPAYPHGTREIKSRIPVGHAHVSPRDTNPPSPCTETGASRIPTGDSLETSRQGMQPAGAHPTGRSTPAAHGDARGKTPPKQKKVRGPHAKRSAAANPLNGADAIRAKFAADEKQRSRELKKLARKIQ